jgi:hypothetical protein
VICEGHHLHVLARNELEGWQTRFPTDDAYGMYIAEMMSAYTDLTKMSCDRHSIGDNAAKHIAAALKIHPALTDLDISNNSLQDHAEHMAAALKENPRLKALNISITNGLLPGDGFEFAQQYGEALEINSCLETLLMRRTGLRDNCPWYIGQALTVNKSLTYLDVSENAISDNGAKYLAWGLKANGTLTRLSIANNSVGQWGMYYVAEALKENTCLTSLDASHNVIGANGMWYLAEVLHKTQTLTELTINNQGRSGLISGIGECGAWWLAEALKSNSSLTKLHMGGNNIKITGAYYIEEALRENVTLQAMDDIYEIQDRTPPEVAEWLAMNSRGIFVIDVQLHPEKDGEVHVRGTNIAGEFVMAKTAKHQDPLGTLWCFFASVVRDKGRVVLLLPNGSRLVNGHAGNPIQDVVPKP